MVLLSTINSLPDICELEVRLNKVSSDQEEIECVVDLRIHNSEIALGDEECQVCFKKLTISVDLEGLDIVPGSRFGEPRKSNEVSFTKHSTQEKSKEKKLGYGLSTAFGRGRVDASASANAGSQSLAKHTTSNESREVQVHRRVKARPNKRWEVAELDNEPLDDTYLENTVLFRANKAIGSNRERIAAEVKVKQRDLLVNQIRITQSAETFFSRLSINQRRLLDIFIAKSISSALYDGKTYIGEIVVSKFEVADEK